jgi:hypothetical protein
VCVRFFLFLALVLLVAAPGARADATAIRLAPVRTASFAHDCDWTWDVDNERCWWDRSRELLVGGDGVRVWRGAVAFDLSGLPLGAVVAGVELTVPPAVRRGGGDGECECVVDAVPATGHAWFREREPDVGPPLSSAAVGPGAQPTVFDVSGAVVAWLDGSLANNGILLRLDDEVDTPDPCRLSFAVGEVELAVVLLEPG